MSDDSLARPGSRWSWSVPRNRWWMAGWGIWLLAAGCTVTDVVRSPWLGVSLKESLRDPDGRLDPSALRHRVVLDRVVEDGPAARAGLTTGDRIVEVGKTPIIHTGDLMDLVRRQRAGRELPVRYHRDGVLRDTVVTLDDTDWEVQRSLRPCLPFFDEDGLRLVILDVGTRPFTFNLLGSVIFENNGSRLRWRLFIIEYVRTRTP